jgi:hypothetical protein
MLAVVLISTEYNNMILAKPADGVEGGHGIMDDDGRRRSKY